MAFSAANFASEIGYALMKNADRLIFDKASISSQVANAYSSLWRATGLPAQGSIPGAAAICEKNLTGAFAFDNPGVGFEAVIGWGYLVSGNAGHAFEVHDRLVNMGGLSGTSTAAQNANIDLAALGVPAARLGSADYRDVRWWLEWYTATGATAVTATVNVTYDDLSTGNISVSIPASTAASRMIPIQPAVAGKGIKGVNTVQLSATTGTVGSFGVTATRHRTAMENDVAGKGKDHSWAMLGAPEIASNSCLFGIVPCNTTTTGTFRGQMKLAKG